MLRLLINSFDLVGLNEYACWPACRRVMLYSWTGNLMRQDSMFFSRLKRTWVKEEWIVFFNKAGLKLISYMLSVSIVFSFGQKT